MTDVVCPYIWELPTEPSLPARCGECSAPLWVALRVSDAAAMFLAEWQPTCHACLHNTETDPPSDWSGIFIESRHYLMSHHGMTWAQCDDTEREANTWISNHS